LVAGVSEGSLVLASPGELSENSGGSVVLDITEGGGNISTLKVGAHILFHAWVKIHHFAGADCANISQVS